MQIGTQAPLEIAISRLSDWLDDTIRQIAGAEGLAAVVEVREMAYHLQDGRSEALPGLTRLLDGLTDSDRRVVTRALAILLDLMNVAEDRQRVHVLHEREQAAHPAPRAESIRAAIAQLASEGFAPEDMQRLLDNLDIRLVLTAHPTEAKRRSMRNKLRRLRELLAHLEDGQLLPRERVQRETEIRAELTKLWQTDFIRPWPPTVVQEVQRGLSILPVLWEVVPAILRDLREALAEHYPDHAMCVPACVHYASWIGGDRDGHPGVTAAVTEQTLIWMRQAAVARQRETVCEMFGSLSLSVRQAPVSEELRDAVAASVRAWPELADMLAGIPPNELYRQWLTVVDWRLSASGQLPPDHSLPRGAYRSGSELSDDVRIIQRSLSGAHNDVLVQGELQRWLDQVDVFGLHLAQLDVRQDARYYETVMSELLARAGIVDDFASLPETTRQQILLETIGRPLQWNEDALSDQARETLSLMMLLRRTMRRWGQETFGGHVISMARAPSDVLTVLCLWEWTREIDGGHAGDEGLHLPIIPLFETIDYLRDAPATMAALLDLPTYRSYLQAQGRRQIVMIGYSDSTKDGGYLAACGALFEAQTQICEVARRRKIAITFFHGRGGSLGRGGGPTARAILSLPATTFDGRLRLTEQGEVLAERYDDPRIAHRHLEQVTWSVLLASTRRQVADIARWTSILQWLADRSLQSYRRLSNEPDFVDFFRMATPIDEIVQLPIGSRPARRKAGGSLRDLRAIPWVFSWTQIRCLLPAWYGLGSAIAELHDESPQRARDLIEMYRQWPYFQAIVDNAALALSKTRLTIAQAYFRLAGNRELEARFAKLIIREYDRCCEAVLQTTGQQHLLDDVAWLRDSIRRRSPLVDALNLLQIDLLGRLRSAPDAPTDQVDEWAHLVRLTIQGVAAGMRTTG